MVALPRRATARWSRSRSSGCPNPLEFGIIIVDDDGRIERFLEKPTWGQVFSDTVNTGIYIMEPEVFDHVATGRVGRLVERRLPAAAGDGRAGLRLRRRRRTGRTSAPTRAISRRRPTCSTVKSTSTSTASRCQPGRLGRRGRRGRPGRDPQGPAVHRRLRQGRGRRRAARVHRARQQRRREERRVPAPGRRARQRLHRSARQPARLRHRQEHRHHARRPGRGRRRRSATSASSRRRRSSRPG